MSDVGATQERVPFYVVVVFACESDWCNTHGWSQTKGGSCGGGVKWRVVRGYETRGAASGMATRIRKGGNETVQVRECYPMESALVHGTVEEKYEAAERAIEVVGKRAAELELAALSPAPTKKSRRKQASHGRSL